MWSAPTSGRERLHCRSSPSRPASAARWLTWGPHARRSGLPLLRKDFIVDPYQVLESFAAGADAILLIVAALSERELASLHAQALDLGLPVLVEIHDARELESAVAAGAQVIGVNNRDLTTLQVDPARTLALVPELPKDVVVVAESGFSSPAELDALARAGVDAVLDRGGPDARR